MKWEYQFYLVAAERDWKSVMTALNDLGQDGWEVATFVARDSGSGFILKRAVSGEGNVR